MPSPEESANTKKEPANGFSKIAITRGVAQHKKEPANNLHKR